MHLALFPAGGPFLSSLSVNISACQSRGRSGSSALLFAGATRPFVGRTHPSRHVPLAGPPMRGLARPSADLVSACLAPRMWVWGVWFGFTLRCVALLCGVFVQSHLALFPAGGPFLPSLSVNISACQRSTDNWKQPKAVMSFL
jgi:hypothetical protein